MQLIERRIQECTGGFGFADAALHQELRDDWRNFERGGKSGRGIFVEALEQPAHPRFVSQREYEKRQGVAQTPALSTYRRRSAPTVRRCGERHALYPPRQAPEGR